MSKYRDVRRRHDIHHRIYEAIKACEPWRAETLMRGRVAGIKASLVKALTERGKDGSAAGTHGNPRGIWSEKAGYLPFTNMHADLQLKVEYMRYIQLFGVSNRRFSIKFAPGCHRGRPYTILELKGVLKGLCLKIGQGLPERLRNDV